MSTALRLVDAAEWDRLLDGFADAGHRQTSAYSQLAAARSGSRCEFVTCDGPDGVLGISSVRVRRVPVIGAGIAYVSGGPLVRRASCDGGQQSNRAGSLDTVLALLVNEYVERRRLVLRVAPALGSEAWDFEQATTFAGAGFVPATGAAHYRTLVVDLGKTADAIRAGLHQKWRNCLNSAERQGLDVRVGSGPDLFDEFAALYQPFQESKGFHADLGADFYAAVQRGSQERHRLMVQIALREGKAVAGHVASVTGDTCVYVLGATNESGLRCKAAYLLQWRAMMLAKERGQLRYDLGGIDPEGNPGVHHFKAGLGGVERRAPGPFELRPRSVRSAVALSAEAIYRRLVHRRGLVTKT